MDILNLYNPARFTEDELIENFVIRENEFESIMDSIKSDKMKTPSQNYIIQGQRGNGKTTLLLRIYYEILRTKQLNSWLIPVIFNEEEYGIRTLYKLWKKVAILLEEKHDIFKGIYTKMEELADSENYEEKCFEILQASLKTQKKKLLLLIDNFGEKLDKFQRKEQQRLREVLITCPDIRIIGASSVIMESTYDYGKPFFDFFKIVPLKGLTKEETKNLLIQLDSFYKTNSIQEIIDKHPGRIEALRRLTSGVPRTIILLFEILTDNKTGDSFKDLEVVLDRVTPLYKHRMDDLSSQQQEIIDVIALNWDAIRVKEIAKKTRMESKAVSSQLNILEQNKVIIKKSTSTKNHFYQVAERFFNIWYLMRNGNPSDKCKVKWLVKFLEIWCDNNELEKRVKEHIGKLRQGNLYDKYAFHFTEAYAQMLPSKELQHKLICKTKKYLKTINSKLVNDLSESDNELINKAEKHYENEQYDLALNCLNKIKNKSSEELFNIALIYHKGNKDIVNAENFYLKAVGKEDSDAMYNLAMLYENDYRDFKKAEKYYLMAIEKGHPNAMYNLALLYGNEYKDYKKAEKYYLLAIKNGDSNAIFNLALLYEEENKDYKKAVKYYLMAIGKGHSGAMYNLAILYGDKFSDYKKAEKYYLMAIEQGESDAINNVALLYENEYKDYKKAEKYYLMAIEKGDSFAMFNLALLYCDEFRDYKKVEKYYLMAIKKGHSGAMYNLAILYNNEYNDYKKAEKYYLMAIENGEYKAMNNLALIYENEYNNNKNAKKYYLMAIEKGDFAAMNNLALLYFATKENKEKALELSKRSFEKEKDLITSYVYANILLWNNEVEKAIAVSKYFIEDKESTEKELDSYLIMLLAKKQYHYVLNLFNINELKLKDKYKPIYYALMTFMQKEYPDEIKKMGEELTQTVEEIINEIIQMEKDYV